jgi:hypothetical protein
MTYWWGFGEPRPALELLEHAIEPYDRGAENTWIAWAEINLAAVNGQLARHAAARRLLEGQGGRAEPHLWMLNAWTVMRVGSDGGDLEYALSAGPAVLAALAIPAPLRRILLDVGIEVLVSAGHLSEARRVAEIGLPGLGGGPLVDRVKGRIGLAAGDAGLAAESFRAAVDGFAGRGIRHEEARTRLLLGEALRLGGDAEAGIAELRTALASAQQRGAIHEESLGRSALRAAGAVTDPTLEQVKAALEELHDTDRVARSPLLELACLGPGASRSDLLRALLQGLVGGLAGSPAYAEKEAARVLEAYYFERRGSHERVAESLHLTMPTYYRRLRGGHLRLAELLREREAAAAASPV